MPPLTTADPPPVEFDVNFPSLGFGFGFGSENEMDVSMMLLSIGVLATLALVLLLRNRATIVSEPEVESLAHSVVQYVDAKENKWTPVLLVVNEGERLAPKSYGPKCCHGKSRVWREDMAPRR